jgi:AraC family transcriptional regulator of adaptative response / DNA-3-methyladenine glycosylase II
MLGGHRRNRGYGRLDCPAALSWIAKGKYVPHRVFFSDEATAIAAGYRPCARCLPDRYAVWKTAPVWPDDRVTGAHCELPFRPPLDAEQLLGFFAARAVPGVESVDGTRYARTLALPHGPALVELDVGETRVSLRLRAGDARDLGDAARISRRLLDLDADPAAIARVLGEDELLAPLVAARPGIRVPGSVDPAETAVRAVVGQQVSVAAARTLLGRLAAEYGEVPRGWSGRGLFPTSERLAAADPAALPMPRARARALVRMCAAIAEGSADLAHLDELPGIGPWTADYVALRGLGDRDAFVSTDLGIKRALGKLGSEGDSERWRPFRAYAAQQLWAAQ